MTSVTEDLSLDETDTSSHDIDTSSQITTSDANEEGSTTVVHTSLLHISVKQEELDIIDVNMEGGSEQDEMATIVDEDKPVRHAPITRPAEQSKHSAQQSSNHSQPSGSGIQFPDFTSMQGEWYQHECFNHYWRHYHFVSIWCQKHMETYKTVVEQYNRMATQQMATRRTMTNSSQPAHVFKKPISKKTIRNRKARRRRKAAKKRLRTALKNAELAGNHSILSQSSEDGQKAQEGETTESAVEEAEQGADMEITEEMLDFFAHTHKHRQERGRWKYCCGCPCQYMY